MQANMQSGHASLAVQQLLIYFHFKSKWSKTRMNILICDTWISLQLFNSLLSCKVSKISSTLSYNYHIIHYHNYVCNINVLRSISTCMSEITWHEFQHKKKILFNTSSFLTICFLINSGQLKVELFRKLVLPLIGLNMHISTCLYFRLLQEIPKKG